MPTDPIAAIQHLGYTQREASFLYLVGAHSGYFLRRQFDYFINRRKGAIARNFLAKAQAARHIEVIEYARGWRVYHLLSRSIYRLLQMPESQNRHRKADASIRSRLITLDYVLENRDDEHYLIGPEERMNFLGTQRRINPTLYRDVRDGLLPVLRSTLVALENRERPATTLVRLLFVDEGLLTHAKFVRVLEELESLLCAIGNFELIYGSNSDLNFKQAAREFWRRFGRYSRAPEAPYRRDLFGKPVQPVEPRVPFAGTMTTIFFQLVPALVRLWYPVWSKVGTESDRGRERPASAEGRMAGVAPAPDLPTPFAMCLNPIGLLRRTLNSAWTPGSLSY